MIEYIKGQLTSLNPAAAVIETAGGVAYLLQISLPTFSKPEPFAVNDDYRLLRKLRCCGNTGYIGSMELIGGKPATRGVEIETRLGVV